MDDFVRNKLTEWGLSEYIQTFKGKVFQWLFVGHRYYCIGAGSRLALHDKYDTEQQSSKSLIQN